MNDKNELICCKSIDEKKFELIYIYYWDQVLQYAINIVHDRSLAQDIVQQVFVSLWDKRHQRQIDNLEVYLKRAVKYTAFHEIKKRLNIDDNTNLSDVDIIGDQESDQDILYKDLHQRLDEIITKLPSKSKDLFVLKFKDGLDNNAIASALDLSEKTIRNKLSICLKSVRVNLKKVGF
ncbi:MULTISPECIES: RNA polymerase sigma factor [unclassified Sphingobacterium]|uniref:RNA polymerase sigma factor n=1 Tax=unclassified Sphingobacterium TaxID=2609468 RepID=UPI001045BC71|nr:MULTISPECIES: sigma-70 family RNA polymerase sigma factor [unclassified Sphingobacterium]MCS3555866.1 RNA polymerase sigma-70 factor (ECF subfamily) [Sphingobacterium sp. JUb21]TCQ95422.1 RNA polymerase sigma-70 factor (ECF subfamily) [Sphingobacterium sp. JUb20]